MAGPAELVNSTYALAQSYAAEAKVQLAAFTSALNENFYTPATISVTWNSPDAPAMPAAPAAPTMPVIDFQTPGSMPGALNEDLPDMVIDTFNEPAPDLNMPAAPTLSYGATPVVPDVANVAVPDAPVLVMPDTPALLALNPVSFAGVDLREEWLEALEQRPELDMVQPTPYSYARGPEYASELLTQLKALLRTRAQGGTGLPAAVEQAIWDRARSRELSVWRGNEAEVMRNSEALGYALLPGVVAHQLREAQFQTAGKLADLSRDVSIKQADLEQANLRDTITAGIQLESQLIDYSYRLEQLTFESARVYADNAIQLHNAALQRYTALLQGYEAYAAVYKTIIDSQLAKVEVYKAQLAAEQTKADINQTLVAQYKTMVEAGMAQAEVYRAQVAGAQTLIQLEQAKIGAAGERIRAFVATVNAETAKVEAYKAGVEAETTKLQTYKIKADVFGTRVQAQADHARALISRFQALQAAKTSEWQGWTARVDAERARIMALGSQSSALLEGFRAETAAVQAQAELQTKVWEGNLRQYEAGIRVSQEAAKMNNDAAMMANNARLDAAKAGTQVYAQLASSAYGMIHTSAGVSGSASMSVGYSYGGDVAGTVAPLPSI